MLEVLQHIQILQNKSHVVLNFRLKYICGIRSLFSSSLCRYNAHKFLVISVDDIIEWTWEHLSVWIKAVVFGSCGVAKIDKITWYVLGRSR